MKDFAELFLNIESTTSTNKKIEYLQEFFKTADDRDKVWVIALFSHRRPRRAVNTRLLREWAAELAHIPLWLFEESYHIVGDLAETIAKVVTGSAAVESKPLHLWMKELSELKTKDEEEKKKFVTEAWLSLDKNERFLFNKLLTGGFRMGVSQKTIVNALSRYLDEDPAILAHKLMGDWSPFTTRFEDLVLKTRPEDLRSKPYPFYLAYPLEEDPEKLGAPADWIAEYKWDGIRGQLIKRKGEIYLWSRGEELISEQFPEFQQLLSLPQDFAVDGEILVIKDGRIQNFNSLQKRLGRKKPGKKIRESHPASMMVYDILEIDGEDIRAMPQEDRRQRLEGWFSSLSHDLPLTLSETLSFDSWEQLEKLRNGAREMDAEGLMLKSRQGHYKTGRKKGDWYKWKIDPLTIDAVMIYAQRGHGRRANLFTDFTFALKNGDQLLPVAKAYSGLTDQEFREISRYVRSNTIERFGPVCSVPAEHVFEIAFEDVAESSRHKSGVAVRFPRILRWRRDKKPEDINTIDELKAMIR